jgi:ABC-type multidrug transport system fused ATPase/permease subunit
VGAGNSLSAVPSINKAKKSANKIFNVIDEASLCDVRDTAGKIERVESGKIELRNVTFNYPSRQQNVLDDLSLTIEAGQKIGLVGHSGCGKSTITALILKFYQLYKGHLLIDGKSIDDYDIRKFRKQIGYVMQEPVLFNQSIKQNILYGKPDATNAEIIRVAEMANARQFIETNFEELDHDEQLAEVRKLIKENLDKLGLGEVTILDQILELDNIAGLNIVNGAL